MTPDHDHRASVGVKAHRLLNRLFGQAEEINGPERCSTYLYRWELFRTSWGKVYVHRFVGDDWSLDLHDHPKRFVSIGIWGSYLEETSAGFRRYCAPWARTFPAEHRHRLMTPWGECWTLLLVLKTVREWGFWHDGQFYPWRSYVDGADAALADRMKSCIDDTPAGLADVEQKERT